MRYLLGEAIRALAMKTVCAWCGKHMDGSKSDPDVSHGICEKCYKKQVGK